MFSYRRSEPDALLIVCNFSLCGILSGVFVDKFLSFCCLIYVILVILLMVFHWFSCNIFVFFFFHFLLVSWPYNSHLFTHARCIRFPVRPIYSRCVCLLRRGKLLVLELQIIVSFGFGCCQFFESMLSSLILLLVLMYWLSHTFVSFSLACNSWLLCNIKRLVLFGEDTIVEWTSVTAALAILLSMAPSCFTLLHRLTFHSIVGSFEVWVARDCVLIFGLRSLGLGVLLCLNNRGKLCGLFALSFRAWCIP